MSRFVNADAVRITVSAVNLSGVLYLDSITKSEMESHSLASSKGTFFAGDCVTAIALAEFLGGVDS